MIDETNVFEPVEYNKEQLIKQLVALGVVRRVTKITPETLDTYYQILPAVERMLTAIRSGESTVS